MAAVLFDDRGMQRKLAALKPTSADFKKGLRRFRDVHPEVDPSTWKDIDLTQTYTIPIRDQGQHGSCTGHAGVTAMAYARMQAGQPGMLLSCTYPYSLVNGGRDEGASVSSILNVLEAQGTCEERLFTEQHIYQNEITPEAQADAQNYMVVEHLMLQDYDEICEAVNRGFAVAFGIAVGRNFSNMTPQGVCPLPNKVVGGHALCGVGLKRSIQGTWLLKFQNSWGKSWGLAGFAFLSSGHFANMLDAYAVVHTKIAVPDGPPVVQGFKKSFVLTDTTIAIERVPGPLLTIPNEPHTIEWVTESGEAIQVPEPAPTLTEELMRIEDQKFMDYKPAPPTGTAEAICNATEHAIENPKPVEFIYFESKPLEEAKPVEPEAAEGSLLAEIHKVDPDVSQPKQEENDLTKPVPPEKLRHRRNKNK